MYKSVSAVAEAHPMWAILRNDGDNAYYRAKRTAFISEAELFHPALADYIWLWYQDPLEFVWFDQRGRPHGFRNRHGFGQGDPGGPWKYSPGAH